MNKLQFNILLSIICFLLANSLFAQKFSDSEIGLNVGKITKKLQERKLSQEEIKIEVEQVRQLYNAQYIEQQKLQEKFFKEELNKSDSQRTANTVFSAVSQEERDVLIALYDALNGPNWTSATYGQNPWLVNDINSDVSTWSGITVVNGHITRIYLFSVNGSIPDLSALKFLNELQLYGVINGGLNGLGANINLKHLVITTSPGISSLESLLPICNLTNLESLRLNSCTFNSNNLPQELTNLINLKHIYIRSSSLSENLSVLGLMPNLSSIILQNSNFYGSLPANFSNLNNLKVFDMSGNNINDISSIVNLNTLQYIRLIYNDITVMPAGFQNLSNLKYINLGGNMLSGNLSFLNSNLQLVYLDITNNQLEGLIPLLTFDPNPSFSINYGLQGQYFSQSTLWIQGNKFRFIDFVNEFNYYNSFNSFAYNSQNYTDFVRNDTTNQGSSYTMRMFEDGRYTNDETYQWYKNGIQILGATSREYTLNQVSQSDSGTYYCLAKHDTITIPSNSQKFLILRRHPITLTVTEGCPKVKGNISTTNTKLCTGKKIDFNFNFDLPSQTITYTYNWTFTDLEGNTFTSSATTPTFLFNYPGIHTIFLTLTGSNGCVDNFEKTIYVDDCTLCIHNNEEYETVKSLFLALVNHLIVQAPGTIIQGYTCPELTALAPYITDPIPAIYNFYFDSRILSFSFNNHGKTGEDVYFEFPYNINLPIQNIYFPEYISNENNTIVFFEDSSGNIFGGPSDGVSSFIRHLDFCPRPKESCTKTNPNSEVVKGLFINLINHLIPLQPANVPNGYICQELNVLAPYIMPEIDVKIYGFINTGSYLQFSFADHSTSNEFDVQIVYNSNGQVLTNISLDNYLDFETATSVTAFLNKGTITEGKNYIRHIEFCPDELYCKKHVVIVVDESGSISDTEARKIKNQLKAFITKQASDNENKGTNMFVSFVGLADQDVYNRNNDEVVLTQRVLTSNLNIYNNWAENIRNRDGQTGISPNSDYWKSGLDRALLLNPDVVILITDGCQTRNAGDLKETIGKFSNNGGGNGNPDAPHLFVVGIDNGFYVDNDTPPSNKTTSLDTKDNPNFNSELTKSDPNARVASYLRTSLKYLMNYQGDEFPVQDKYNFIYKIDEANLPNLIMVDYFGTTDFNFFYDEINYISNGLAHENASISCGDVIPPSVCNNCLNFKPQVGKDYILSAWTKEELIEQVQTYPNPQIQVIFKDYGKNIIPNTLFECTTSGDIIDGWQRIFKKFTVPDGAVYIDVSLVNKSDNIPVYFDDIRIHPMDGSMKSFVYDPETFRLMSELDENNYSTFYEYDNEGGLVRVKKETSRGVKTIQETRSGNVIKLE